jgi:outer membrane receptor protein involved in Fe transport
MPSQRGNLNVSFVCLVTLFANRTLAAAPDLERDAAFDTEAATASPSALPSDLFASFTPTALAQTSESSSAPPPVNSNPSVAAAGGRAEIVVTAQKRGENLQDVPISVVAFSADALTSAGVRTTADLWLCATKITS